MFAAARSSFYIFLDVVSSNTYRTISGVQLGHCLVCLLPGKSIVTAVQYIVVSSAYR